MSELCRVCGQPVTMQIFKSTGVCRQICQAQWEQANQLYQTAQSRVAIGRGKKRKHDDA